MIVTYTGEEWGELRDYLADKGLTELSRDIYALAMPNGKCAVHSWMCHDIMTRLTEHPLVGPDDPWIRRLWSILYVLDR